MEFVPRFFHKPVVSYFLFGPRGTGKSTFLKDAYQNALYLDLLSPDIFRMYSARPERLKEVVAGHAEQRIVIIDEIQKIPDLLDVVHQLVESHQQLQFILTGSSSRKLKRSGVDLLAGRALFKTMHPFMASELRNEFHLDSALQYGLIPVIASSTVPKETLNAYIALYLREEVQMEGFVRKIGDFSRFLETMSFSQGSVLNLAEIARECQVGRKTVEGYLSVLEDLLLSFTLPVFSKRAKRHLTVHPKFYFFDVGVFRALRPAGPLDAPSEIDGVALETLVAQHLRAWNEYSGSRNTLYFWRTKAGREVDFVVYGEEGIYALEVKNTNSIRSNDLKNLQAFKEDYPQAELLLLYRGAERLKRDDVLCIPCEEFLRSVSPGKPLSRCYLSL